MGGLVSSLSGKLLVSRRSNFFCGQESNSPTFTKHEGEKKGRMKREEHGRVALRNRQEFGF